MATLHKAHQYENRTAMLHNACHAQYVTHRLPSVAMFHTYQPHCMFNCMLLLFLLLLAFSLRARILGECLTIHSPPALFLFGVGFFFFLIVEISLHTLIPLFRPGSVHSGSMSWDDCVWVFPDKLRVNSFPDRFPHYAWLAALSAHSDFIGSRVYVCLGVTCHLHF